ncbi:latent nuclear antigen [Pseudanabaena sp. lw0831]|uniref:hypothetical protein n=1 Tax=Pseudanabaena sp. lw0831 TaxID=1357935 RepID=UPI00191582A1|nr:hypothetical protein [Pseudanabaena sp. lw0831]GBO55144.1 latent nuclear antigen [Pseudanabaena sp. lw0831]
MSQAGFGDSSAQERISPLMPEPQTPLQSVSSNVHGEPTTLFNALPRQVLEQELQFCNERSQQAQVLLRQAQEQLQLSQLVIQRQETLTQTLQSRIDQLERELQDVHVNCDELRDRLKRQQHHTSQLKAALERCLDTSTPAPNDMALSALESWSIAKLADEKITPVEASNDSTLQNVVKIVPAPQPIELEDSQELKPFATDLHQSEVMPEVIIEEPEPLQLSMPSRTQPISPLIMRPHKASQGSPISPNLPPLQVVAEPKDERIVNWRIEAQPEQQPIAMGKNITANNDSSDSSLSAVTNSAMVSTVATPKFMQALYGSVANPEREEDTQLVIANSSPRKAVTSLAAVQLPQFPPLPRR